MGALLGAGAASADVPRLDLSLGVWDADISGQLSSNNALIAVPPGFQLEADQSNYARFGVRLGSAWWAPVIRGRYTTLGGEGGSFVDNSLYLGNILINLNTTATSTEADFDQLEGLMYFTYGEKVRAELGGGVKRLDGSIRTVQVNNTSLNGEVVTRAERDLPSTLGVFYGAAYAEPVSWLSFGGEAVAGSSSGTEVLDLTFRFILKPLTWVGVEGGYRRLTLQAENDNNTTYDFEFGGPYAGLSFLYGSKSAGLMQPDNDEDGVRDKDDQCPESTPGVVVNEMGCEPDADGDTVPDGRDDCLETPAGAEVTPNGCHKDSDGDGSPDGVDTCPDTPAGSVVDAQGCPPPPVVDPAAAAVEQGPDADTDGIPDDRDQCPETAGGAEVGPDGCPTAAAVTEPVAPVPAPVTESPHALAGPDEDQDGVGDAKDRCRRTPRGFKVDANGCMTKQATTLQGITFQVNSSYLMRDSEVLLLDVVEALKADKTSKIVIQGHTCDLGDAKYNKWLSQRRANRVLEFLVRHGIDAGRLLSVGYGEEQFLVPNDDERMRELNRRTVFQVMDGD